MVTEPLTVTRRELRQDVHVDASQGSGTDSEIATDGGQSGERQFGQFVMVFDRKGTRKGDQRREESFRQPLVRGG